MPNLWNFLDRRTSFLGLACLILALACGLNSPSHAQAIYTGSQAGAYNSTFCPPLPDALKQQYFTGYYCQTSGGTGDNIKNVLAKPTSIAFVQTDVMALEAKDNPDLLKKLTVVRTDIACEGLWMVTKNPKLSSFGDVLGYARRIPFVLPSERSGSALSFKLLQSLDPDGLGRATNVKYVNDTTTVINTIANDPGLAVGFFVQFADPQNENIKLMMEKGLTVIPVVSRQITQAKIGDQDLYQVQSYNLTSGGFFASADSRVTACTPVSVITGNPDAMTDKNAHDNQKELVDTIQKIPSQNLLPKEPRLAKLISGIKSVSGSALNDMLAAADKARDAAQKAMQ